MKKRYISLVMAVLLIVMSVIISGCGADTSKVAGNVSQIAGEESADTSGEDAADTFDGSDADYESSDATANSAEATGELKYDSTEFLSTIEPWNGQPYCEINNNIPDIEEIWATTQESLDPLDSLGRCGTANSCIGTDGMPTEPRGNISEIHPTGWHTDKYEGVEGGNLYNRCHLIAHKLSGDDAVARNLITGTSYMNRDGMLPFEDQIYEYVKSTGNHVMYRVTPCFEGDDLVARGVHMQAISVEDQGKGLAFNVFCYNVQPGIEIDYATGDNRLAGDSAKAAEQAAGAAQEETQTENGLTADTQNSDSADENENTIKDDRIVTVLINTNPDRRRIHVPGKACGEKTSPEHKLVWTGTADELIELAKKNHYVPCGSCHPENEFHIDLPK